VITLRGTQYDLRADSSFRQDRGQTYARVSPAGPDRDMARVPDAACIEHMGLRLFLCPDGPVPDALGLDALLTPKATSLSIVDGIPSGGRPYAMSVARFPQDSAALKPSPPSSAASTDSRASMHQCFQGAEENAQIVLSLVEGRDTLIDVEQRVDRDLSRADRIFDCEDDVVGDLAILANKGDVGRAHRLDQGPIALDPRH
jgi:hypothetical protein